MPNHPSERRYQPGPAGRLVRMVMEAIERNADRVILACRVARDHGVFLQRGHHQQGTKVIPGLDGWPLLTRACPAATEIPGDCGGHGQRSRRRRHPAKAARARGKGRITSIEGIPALSLDAISSVAYGPEAMLVVLATAGAGALAKIEPIAGSPQMAAVPRTVPVRVCSPVALCCCLVRPRADLSGAILAVPAYVMAAGSK